MVAAEEGCSRLHGDQTDPVLIKRAGLIHIKPHARTGIASHCEAIFLLNNNDVRACKITAFE